MKTLTILAGRTYVDGGFRPALAKIGPKWLQVVYIDGARVKVKRIPNDRRQRFADLPGEYTAAKLARAMLKPRNCLGIKMIVSKSARQILRAVQS